MSQSGIKSKKCDFTFALSDISQAERIISELPDFDIWAYIKHFPDSDTGSDHYHFYIHVKQPITLHNFANKLDIPDYMIEWVRNKTQLIQYLIHKNNPDKIQYNPLDIQTNNRAYIDKFLNPVDDSVDIFKEFNSLFDLSSGLISFNDYLSANSNNISSLPFYSRQIFLMRLLNLQEGGSASKKIF